MEKKDLKPAGVFKYFEEICQVPRPSKKEEKMIAYLKAFGAKHNLETKVDEAGNVLIKKPATPGKENLQTVVLQSHIDMVCEKNNDVQHDFLTDPIETEIDGEWLKAKGTTLGADNGIGVATELAILADDSIEHGPLECLFTVDEETGLTGAFALKEGFMSGDILLNLDSEDEGEIFIGCAGGIDSVAEFTYKEVEVPAGYFFFKVEVKGLKGGHSGGDIHLGRGNANKILNRFLTRRSPLKELNYRYVMTDSPDLRGIDVALLYQRDLFKLLSFRSVSIPPLKQFRPTRDLLHVSGLLLTGDTLDVFVCHLPSRSGGAKESEPYRLHAARILYTEADSILNIRLHPQIIIMGDFNDYPTNKSIQKILEAESPPPTAPSPLKLYHLLARKAQSKNFGSYKYRGEWGLLDHLIVSGSLLNSANSFSTSENKATVSNLPFLLTEDKKYGDKEPFRTYKGMKYQGGISDHLPIYVDFNLILY